MADDAGIRGDAIGGVTATVLAIPETIAYGALVFAPLGPTWAAHGVVAGLCALAATNLAGAWFAGVPVLNSGPLSIASVMLSAGLATLLAGPAGGDTGAALALLWLTVMAIGALQIAFGALRIGDVAKYIPHPVLSGMVNGAALVLVGGQAAKLVGGHFDAVAPGAVAVALITIAAAVASKRGGWRVPPPFAGLVAGTLAWHGLHAASPLLAMGPVVGEVPASLPDPRHGVAAVGMLLSPVGVAALPAILPLAGALAVVVSLHTLVVSVSVDHRMGARSDTNRELVAQGVGNLAAALFGGIVSAGAGQRALAAWGYGARTWRSRLFAGLAALLVMAVAGPLLAVVPEASLAALLVVIAFTAFDPAVLGWLRDARTRHRGRVDLLVDSAVAIGVMVLLVVGGPAKGIGFGVAASVVLFAVRMGGDIVRRTYTADKVRSFVERTVAEAAVLDAEGHRIRVVELEGSLFFGTADRLATRVEEAADASIVIVDLSRVSRVDRTGAAVLARMRDRMAASGRRLWLCQDDEALLAAFESPDAWPGIDEALAAAEDALLAEKLGEDRYDHELPITAVDALAGLSEADALALRPYAKQLSFAAGDVLFEQGDPGDGVYALTSGRVDVRMTFPGRDAPTRIKVLCPGTLVGEMALVSSGRRSATAVARSAVTAWWLPADVLERITAEHPVVGVAILRGISRELARRLVTSNRIAAERS